MGEALQRSTRGSPAPGTAPDCDGATCPEAGTYCGAETGAPPTR